MSVKTGALALVSGLATFFGVVRLTGGRIRGADEDE